jgi:aspartyl-tRNA(Asn)/glutamyl-tRNA(Gln) amidotransferase subunit C
MKARATLSHSLRCPAGQSDERSREERTDPRPLGCPNVAQISRDEVARLAQLARRALTDAELDSFAGQLDAILRYVGQVQSVDVTDVTPTDNPLKGVNVTRADVVEPCLTQDEVLAGAPAAVDGRFAVPRILGEPQ